MALSHQQHVMACALWVEKHHGERGAVFIAERIGALALEGDSAGVAMWKQIAAAYTALMVRGNIPN